MIRSLILLLFIVVNLMLARDIDAEIKKTSERIKTFDKDNTLINRNMAKNAKKILKQKNTLLKQTKELNQVQRELSLKEKEYASSKTELALLKESSNTLTDEQEKIEQELVFAIARNASLMLVLDDKDH